MAWNISYRKRPIDRGPDKALTLLPSGCVEVQRTPTALRFKPRLPDGYLQENCDWLVLQAI
jgi:hypothetical protein